MASQLFRWLLIALQACVTILSLLLSCFDPASWLGKLHSSMGVFACGGDSDCWQDQMVYRPQVAGFLTFIVVGVLAAVGFSVVKGTTIALLFLFEIAFTFLFLVLPNSIFSFFADLSIVVSSVFLVAQAILLIDIGCTVNDHAMGAATSARRRNISSTPERNIKVTVIVVSCLLLLASIAGAIALWVAFDNGWVVVAALVVSMLLLLVSILEWCEAGNLFTSCLIVLYSVWLSYEALVAQPGDGPDSRPLFFKILALFVVFGCLAAAILGSGFNLQDEPEAPMADLEGADGSSSPTPPLQMKTALIQCGIHATAALYVMSELAPSQNQVGFAFRVIALVTSLIAYAWTLVAPKLLKNRQF